MPVLPLILLGRLVYFALASLLLDSVPPAVAPTLNGSSTYIPPFLGGQCDTGYWVQVRLKSNEGSTFYVWTSGTQSENPDQISPNSSQQIFGGVKGITFSLQSNGANVTVIGGTNSVSFFISNFGQGNNGLPDIFRVRRADGQPDSCGNLPNPNPPPSIGVGGIAQSPPPILAPPPNGDTSKITLILAGIAAAIAAAAASAATAAANAAAAAASAAGNGSVLGGIAQAVGGIAQAIGSLAEGLKQIFKFLEEIEKQIRKIATKESDKEKEDSETVVRYEFGRATKDGFLRLYPQNNPERFKLSYLDISVNSIPSSQGRFFGNNSPNRFIYKSLGYISFVSPTFGVLQTTEIEFYRTSIIAPENSFGFFYHFGLDGVLSANISGYYIKTETQII